MRCVIVVALALVIGGCGKGQNDVARAPREVLTVDSLGVNVEKLPRTFMLSDKRGGFIVGTAGDAQPTLKEIIWSIQGTPVVTGWSVTLDSAGVASTSGIRVFPHQVVIRFTDGSTATVSPLEISGAYAMAVHIQRMGDGPIRLTPSLAREFMRKTSGDSMITWSGTGNARLVCYTGTGGRAEAGGIRVTGGKEALFLLVYEQGPAREDLATLHSRIPALQQSRSDRMNRLLNRAYIKTSDADLNKALSWTRLSLDALVLTLPDRHTGGEEHVAVAGLPWDGDLRGREMAIAIPGLDFTFNDFAPAGGILRWLAAHQDTVARRRSYGRIADHISGRGATFRGADVAPWFIRQMYEHAVGSGDTVMVRELAAVVRRSVEGALRYQVDQNALFTHSTGEISMDALVPRGNCAAEMQLLWYFQQLIGGFVAEYNGDTLMARTLGESAARTSGSFGVAFVDTSRDLLFDHLLPSGEGVMEIRPNVLFCVDILGSERVKQTMLKNVVNTLVYPWGVGTLARSDPKFHAHVEDEGNAPKEEATQNGPVWTWLAGQLVYTLSRYDRQDLTYGITRYMATRILTTDMVGALPEVYEAALREGESLPRSAGLQASLTGMAEFIRSFYQDYLGVRVDAVSGQMWVQPKLPDDIRDVDFTVSIGEHPVHVQYVRGDESARVMLDAPDIPRPLKVNFVWIFMNGDAWKGWAMIQPGSPLTLIFGSDDLVAYSGEDVIQLPSQRKLKGFSMRNEFTGIEFAGGK